MADIATDDRGRVGATGLGMTMRDQAVASPVAELESSPSVGPLKWGGN